MLGTHYDFIGLGKAYLWLSDHHEVLGTISEACVVQNHCNGIQFQLAERSEAKLKEMAFTWI
jgi:hypothetical protein